MKKSIFTIFLLLAFLSMDVRAQQITEQQAMDRALQFLNTNKAAKARGLDGKQLKLEAAEVEAKASRALRVSVPSFASGLPKYSLAASA